MEIENRTDNLSSADPLQWVHNYADHLYTYAISRISDEELARDLVQDTFLAALERVVHFEGRSSERTWLTAILKNKIVDAYRKKGAAIVRNIPDLVAGQEPDHFEPGNGHWRAEYAPKAFGSDMADPLQHKEFEKILKACIGKLPPLWVAVFTMKHIDEEQTDTICTQLQVSQSNFWVIIHRAKVNLRACLQKNWI